MATQNNLGIVHIKIRLLRACSLIVDLHCPLLYLRFLPKCPCTYEAVEVYLWPFANLHLFEKCICEKYRPRSACAARTG